MSRNRFQLWLIVALASSTFDATSVTAQDVFHPGTWSASPMEFPAGNAGKSDETLREIVHVSLGSDYGMQVTLSNEFGHEPLTIGAVTVAHRTTGSSTDTPVAVTFGGKPGVTIAPGMRATGSSNLKFPAQSDVVVSILVPAQVMTTVTAHALSSATNYSAPGDQTRSMELTTATTVTPWRYLVELDVLESTGLKSIVCLGDSITDGARSTKDSNHRWPDLLAARLGGRLGVLNEGISGNRILNDRTGPSALARFDRDVLDTDYSRKFLIILEGINDIGHAYDPNGMQGIHESRVNADELIAAYHLMIVRAHTKGMRVFGATLTPYTGAKYASAEGEKVRQALNKWIRTTKELDGVIDFDKATRDPANPVMFVPAFDSGDHLHPNDAGMKAMADNIDLNLFAK